MTKDSDRAFAAAKNIMDGRDPKKDTASILITLDHTIASVLLLVMDHDARKAAAMFNEGTVQHVEERLALYAARQNKDRRT